MTRTPCPERLFTQGSSEGPSKGQTVDRDAFEKMLNEYYDLAGWDILTGIPTEEKVKLPALLHPPQ